MRHSPMKNFIKSMVIASAMLLGSTTAYASQPLLAESGVGAQLNNDRTWNFTVGKNRDLFSNMKNLMPGDTIENTVVITNKSSHAVTFYFQVKPGDGSTVAAGSEDAAAVEGKTYQPGLLDIIDMNIWRGSDLLYQGKASGSQPDGDGGILLSLGEVAPQGDVSLRVEVRLPGKEMTNEFAASFGKIDWQFIAEGTDSGNGGNDSNNSGNGGSGGNRPGDDGTAVPDGPGVDGQIDDQTQTPAGGDQTALPDNQAQIPAEAPAVAAAAGYQGGGVLAENVPAEELFSDGTVIGNPDDMRIIVEDEPVPLAAFGDVMEPGLLFHYIEVFLILMALGLLFHYLRQSEKRREYRKY